MERVRCKRKFKYDTGRRTKSQSRRHADLKAKPKRPATKKSKPWQYRPSKSVIRQRCEFEREQLRLALEIVFERGHLTCANQLPL